MVTPNVPATQSDDVAGLTGDSPPVEVGTPAASVAGLDTSGTPQTTDSSITTPLAESGVPATPDPAVQSAGTTPDVATQAAQESTPDSSPAATAASGTINIAGDGTGGSGQPGERSSNTEAPVASPSASPIAAVEVEGCEIITIPPFTGTTDAYVTTAEVFFRQGPGTECTPVYEVPLGEGQEVKVIGGPVSQTTDDTLWVQVEVDGVPGWVSFDFVEPAG